MEISTCLPLILFIYFFSGSPYQLQNFVSKNIYNYFYFYYI